MSAENTGENTEKRGRIENLRPPWAKGESGNPGGRPRKLLLTDDLRQELEDPKVRKAVVKALIDKAKKGSRQHFQEIADRVEGKPAQRIELGGFDGGNIGLTIDDIDRRLEELLTAAGYLAPP